MKFLERFKKPESKDTMFGKHRQVRFCWWPVKRYLYQGGKWNGNAWEPGRITPLKGRVWMRWAELTKNIYHGWIMFVEEQ